jgi:hypothetical protein
MVGVILAVEVLSIWWRFESDLQRATAHSAQGSTLATLITLRRNRLISPFLLVR